MSAAVRAVHLGSNHQEAPIDARADGVIARTPEARPAGATLELRIGIEERSSAPGTRKDSGAVFAVQRAREGTFRVPEAQHRVLRRRQRALPLLVGLFDGI